MQTIEEIRHANLHLLSGQGHSQAAIGRAIDVDRRQVNQWFVTPPLRNLSSENARAIETSLSIERGSLDHPNLGKSPSQSARLDRQKLIAAIKIAMRSEGGVTAENIADAYELLIERAAAPEPSGTPRPKPKGPSGNGAVRGRDSGAVEDPGRTIGARKKAKA